MRKVLLLGASGSIGTQSLDILKAHPDLFTLVGFSVGRKVEWVDRILNSFPSVSSVCVQKEEDAVKIRKKRPDLKIYWGDQGLYDIVDEQECDMVENALVGFVGLAPSVLALEKGRILSSANKESLVVGGTIINRLLSEGKGKLIPIDSEHVGLAKLLSYVGKENVEKVYITASGGAFRDLSREQLAGVTPEQALAHPNWAMGAKITTDCATMMNKGFEVIEADVLFGLKSGVFMHRESHIHALALGKDGRYYADVSAPDMHGPIEYALMEGRVPFMPVVSETLEGLPYKLLPFNPDRYPAVGIALASHKRGGNSNAILNAANEMAVYAFLDKRIPFLQIEEEVRYALDHIDFIPDPDLVALVETDRKTREVIERHIGGR